MITISKKVSYVLLYAIAMALLETAVVVYLRELYYKDGFAFPLRNLPATIAITELLREAATVVMLVAIGFLCGKNKLQRFAYFCLAFAVWDIFYYVFLYVLLSWPQSLFTWDILFLIPLMKVSIQRPLGQKKNCIQWQDNFSFCRVYLLFNRNLQLFSVLYNDIICNSL